MSGTVHAVAPDMPAPMAAEFLASHGYTAAPVTTADGNLIGVVTATALTNASSPAAVGRLHRRRHRHTATPSVRDLMITPVESMTPGADITHVVDMMFDRNVDWLPIVNGHTIVGVITPADLFRSASPPLP